jgi:hypothetical protein
MKNPANTSPSRRIVLVHWKNPPGRVEVFSNLKIFCQSCPQFNYHTLDNHLSKGSYENDAVRIERKPVFARPRPDLPKRFFWEADYDRIDWQASYRTIIQRILERGREKEWKELIRFYGRDKIITALKEEINFLPDGILEDVAHCFGLKKEKMRCYIRKQSRPQLWI